MARALYVLIIGLLVALAALPAASAEWSGNADIETASVNINFSERLIVEVTNEGAAPIDVLSVTVTINWDGMPTLYEVFEGTATLAPEESRQFVSPPTRIPNVDVRDYTCFAGVTARGPDGVAVEHRFPSSIAAQDFTFSVAGIPEELLVPAIYTALIMGVTASLFRWKRSPRWPFVEAMPRWTDQVSRRT